MDLRAMISGLQQMEQARQAQSALHGMVSDVDVLGAAMGDIMAGGYGGYGGLGDVSIIGDDVDTVLEALGGPAMHTAADPTATALAHAMSKARQIDPAAVAVRQQALKSMGYQPVGFPEQTFLAVGPLTQTLSISVTRPFRPNEVLVPSTIAPFFRIDSAKINGRDQLAGAGPVPCEVFSSAAFRSRIRFETVNPSAPLLLQVTMTDATIDRIFRGAFIGAALMR
jgi:hypothetical protein